MEGQLRSQIDVVERELASAAERFAGIGIEAERNIGGQIERIDSAVEIGSQRIASAGDQIMGDLNQPARRHRLLA